MTREDIIKLMRESCDTDKVDAWGGGFWTVTQEELERFANLVEQRAAAAEREECAKTCDLLASALSLPSSVGLYFAKTIRARGE